MPLAEFSPAFLADLLDRARASPRRRQHHNVHLEPSDPAQRLFNAILPDSYIRPHRHAAAGKDELLMAVRGRFALVTFDEDGKMTAALPCGNGPGDHAGVEMGADQWHTVIALEPSILFEVKRGPFQPTEAKDLAEWSPAEGTAEARDYLLRLREQALSMLGGEHAG